MSDPNLPFNKQPFAGSAWATNEDAGIAANLRRRAEQGLPPPWYQPPAPEQIRKQAARKMNRHYRGAASHAYLAVLFVIAGVSLTASRPASALAAFAISGLFALLSVRRVRRTLREMQETKTGTG
jgi:hypothetical protein